MFRITESEMCFGDFPDDNVFYMEKSSVYQTELKAQGVKTCEFVLLRDSDIYYIEAKTSNPRELSSNSSLEQRKKYDEYIEDIVGKMRHSFCVFAAIKLQRQCQDELSQALQNLDYSSKSIIPILVVKNAEPNWLAPIMEKLNSILRPELVIWNIPRIYVINEDMARQRHLVK